MDLPEEGLPTIPISGSLGMREGRRVGRYMFSLVDAVILLVLLFFFFIWYGFRLLRIFICPCFLFLFFFCFYFSKPREAYERKKKKRHILFPLTGRERPKKKGR